MQFILYFSDDIELIKSLHVDYGIFTTMVNKYNINDARALFEYKIISKTGAFVDLSCHDYWIFLNKVRN